LFRNIICLERGGVGSHDRLRLAHQPFNLLPGIRGKLYATKGHRGVKVTEVTCDARGQRGGWQPAAATLI